MDVSPEPTRVEAVIQTVRVLQDPCDVSFVGAINLGRAVGFNRQEVLSARSRQLSNFETMLNEVTLGVSQIRAVEPNVALIAQAINSEPTSPLFVQTVEFEPMPIQDGVGVAKLFNISPQAGNVYVQPATVIEIDVAHMTPIAFFSRSGLPTARQGYCPVCVS